ncbi:hypothetical protein [Halopseudomonas sp.]
MNGPSNNDHPSKSRIRCRWLRRGAICKRHDGADKAKGRPMVSSDT